MLKGCPTPAMDPGEARALLIDAASSGDRGALLILTGPTSPNSLQARTADLLGSQLDKTKKLMECD
jgi:hypothetical protein